MRMVVFLLSSVHEIDEGNILATYFMDLNKSGAIMNNCVRRLI